MLILFIDIELCSLRIDVCFLKLEINYVNVKRMLEIYVARLAFCDEPFYLS